METAWTAAVGPTGLFAGGGGGHVDFADGAYIIMAVLMEVTGSQHHWRNTNRVYGPEVHGGGGSTGQSGGSANCYCLVYKIINI